MKTITKLKTGAITVAVVAVIIIISSVWRCVSSSNSISAADSTRTEISPAQIRSMHSIGQWEFLTVSDEELVDTVRHGFFGDDELIRIYYGTLRLGCDLSKASDNWVRREGDSTVCELPPVQLLDNRFIDEARTTSFFEKGKWSDADREQMYRRAQKAMMRRALSPQNVRQAKENARQQLTAMLRALGCGKISITFSQEQTK